MAPTNSNYGAVVALNVTTTAGLVGWGTGIIVGPHAILTAAHVPLDARGSYTLKAAIGVGTAAMLSDISESTSNIAVRTMPYLTPAGYGSAAGDYAVIGVAKDLSKIAQPMSIGDATAPVPNNASVHLTGYSLVNPAINNTHQLDVGVTPTYDAANGWLSYSATGMVGGASGGPVWYQSTNNGAQVVGICDLYSYLPGHQYEPVANYAAAITPAVAATLNRWIGDVDQLFSLPIFDPADQSKPGPNIGLEHTIIGDYANNFLAGTIGRDFYVSSPGNDRFDGGAGFDTAIYELGGRANYTVTLVGQGESGANIIVTKPGGATDSLSNVERLQFADSVVTFDPAGDVGQLYRAFKVAFASTPTPATLTFWVKAAEGGADIQEIIRSFAASPQFTSINGPTERADDVVTSLYHQALHREPEDAGLAYWVEALNQHHGDATTLITGFAESAELKAQLIGVVEQGIVTYPL